MESRLNYQTEAHRGAVQAMYGLENYIRYSSLDKKIIELVKTRCSQINGCAYCIDMHTKDARAAGETEQRLYGLNAWRETSYYNERERSALEWAEALTVLPKHKITDALFEQTQAHFDEDQLVTLCLVVSTINAWNRLAIASAMVPGSYQVKTNAA